MLKIVPFPILINERIQIGEKRGLCKGLLEAIRLGLKFRFGDQALELMPFIRQIKDTISIREQTAIHMDKKTQKGYLSSNFLAMEPDFV